MGKYIAISFVLLLVAGILGLGQNQLGWGESRDLLYQVLEFIYTAAHWLGELIVNAVRMIVPMATIPDNLIDPIGLLAVLTIFLAAAEIVKKLTWIVVVVGWLLIFVRIVMAIVEGR